MPIVFALFFSKSLSQIYAAVVEAVLAGIDSYSKMTSPTKVALGIFPAVMGTLFACYENLSRPLQWVGVN